MTLAIILENAHPCWSVSDLGMKLYSVSGFRGSSVHRIIPAGTLGQVAISYSRGSSQRRDGTQASCACSLAGGFFTTAPTRKPPSWIALKMLVMAAGVWRHDSRWQVHFQGGSLPGLARGWWALGVYLFTGPQCAHTAWQLPSPRGCDPTEGNRSHFAFADLIWRVTLGRVNNIQLAAQVGPIHTGSGPQKRVSPGKWDSLERDFPGPVAENLSFHCRRNGLIPREELRSCVLCSMAKKHINKTRLKTESRGAVLEADFHTWRRRPCDLYFFIRASTEENHWWFPFLVLHACPTRPSWHSCSQNVMTFYKIIPISFLFFLFFFGYAMWHVRS